MLRQARARTQIFEVSTLYGAATLAAALDAGMFGPRDDARRILLVSNNAAIPETAVQLAEMDGFTEVSRRFDEIIDWNREISPQHPSAWHPAPQDAPLWQRLLRRSWGLGGTPMDLVVESVTAAPARALATIFGDARLHVYADGLMSYGPTREKLPAEISRRIARLLILDLVPGLTPLLLSEHDVPAEAVPADAFRGVLAEIAAACDDGSADSGLLDAEGGRPTAVVLGQYLAALNILSVEEEEELLVTMVRGAVAEGHRSVLFKPHPTAPSRYSTALEKAAADAGALLTTLNRPMLAEAVYEHLRPRLVVGCFSTAMFTASGVYGVPIARTGTELLLKRLRPYQNSNRVPAAIVDATVPEVGGGAARFTADGLQPLVHTVGYAMQSGRLGRLRPEAEAWLAAQQDDVAMRYVGRHQRTKLGLPGGVIGGKMPRRLIPTARKAVRVARRVRRVIR